MFKRLLISWQYRAGHSSGGVRVPSYVTTQSTLQRSWRISSGKSLTVASVAVGVVISSSTTTRRSMQRRINSNAGHVICDQVGKVNLYEAVIV